MKKTVLILIFAVILCTLTACQNGKTELIWVVPESYMPNENVVDILNDKLANMGCDYKVKFVEIKYEEDKTYTDVVKEKINSAEKIDIVYSGSPNSLENDNYNSSYYRFAVEGIFEPLGQFLDTDEGKKLLGIFPQTHIEAMMINGDIYGVNGALTTLSTDNILLLNKEKGNLQWDYNHIYSLDEVGDMLKINNSSYTTTLMLFSQYLSYSYFANYTQITNCLYINNHNEIVFVLDDNKYIDFLIKCKEMQQDGIIIDGMGEEMIHDPYLSFEDCVGGYELSKSFNNSEVRQPYSMIPLENENYIRFSNLGTGICKTSTEKEKAFELLSLCFTDKELNNLLVFGEENVDYILKDGIPTNTNRFENLRVFAFGNRLICYPLYFETENKKDDYYTAYENALFPSCMGFVFNDSSIKEKVVITNYIINDFYNSLLNTDITAEKIEMLTEEYKTLLNDNGLQDIISELTKQYIEFLSHKGE